MNDKKKNGFRFLVTYICVLMPILATCFGISEQTIQSMRSKETASVQAQLSRTVEMMNEQYTSFQMISTALGSSSELMPSKMAGDQEYFSTYEGIEVLEDANLYNPTTTDIFLYYGGRYVYSARGRSSIDVYLLNSLHCSADRVHDLVGLLNEMSFCAFYTEGDGTNGYIVLHYPVRFVSSEGITTMNFTISAKKLGELMAGVGETTNTYLSISFKNSGTVYYASNENYRLDPVAASAYPAGERLQEYTVISESSDLLGLTMELLYPSELLLQQIQRSQWINIGLICGGSLLSLLLAFQISRYWSRKIRDIEDAFENEDRNGLENGTNDLENIRTMIVNMKKQNQMWRSNAQFSRETIKRQLASMIFQGVLSDPSVAHELLEFCGMTMFDKAYFVGGIQMKCSDTSYAEFMKLLTGDLCCELKVNDINTIVFLLDTPQADVTQSFRVNIAERLSQVLDLFGANHIRIAMSRVCTRLNQANAAYLEVCDQLTKMDASNEKLQISCHEFTQQDPDAVPVTQQEIDSYVETLRQRNAQESIRQFRILQMRLSESTCDGDILRFLRYQIVQRTLQVIEESTDVNRDQLRDMLLHIDPANPESFSTVETVIRHYCAEDNTDKFDRVLAYIQQNYMRVDLTQEEVADKVGLSRSFLSRVFQSRAGTSYMDYLTKLRLKKARELLLTTDIPVAKVFQQVGYVSRNNYSQKFKDFFGVSASDMRRNKQMEIGPDGLPKDDITPLERAAALENGRHTSPKETVDEENEIE